MDKKRLEDIVYLWNEGMPLQKIAGIYSLTRERVRQIKKYAAEHGYDVKKVKIAKGSPCSNCGKILDKQYKGDLCARCYYHYQNPEAKWHQARPKNCIKCERSWKTVKYISKGLCSTCYQTQKYNTDLEFREKYKARQKIYRDRRKKLKRLAYGKFQNN